MRDEANPREVTEGGELRPPYDPPEVILLGNARDLLAGGSGTLDDSLCSPSQVTRNSMEPCP